MSLIVALMPLRHNRNTSLIARTAGVAGCECLIVSGPSKMLPRVTRETSVPVKNHRTLLPVLKRYRNSGYEIVSLELTPKSKNLTSFSYSKNVIIVAGNENLGVPPDILDFSDHVVKAPVYGNPPCYNVAVATSMAIYEYLRQHP